MQVILLTYPASGKKEPPPSGPLNPLSHSTATPLSLEYLSSGPCFLGPKFWVELIRTVFCLPPDTATRLNRPTCSSAFRLQRYLARDLLDGWGFLLWTYLVTHLNLVCKEYHRNCTSKLIIFNQLVTVICVNTWLHLITVNTQLI